MKYPAILFLLLLAACNSQPVDFEKPEDGLDAAREFIRAELDGDYVKGGLFILKDEEDQKLYQRYVDYMKKRPGKELIELKQASILVNKVEELSDSVHIINYSNSYSKRPMDIKMVRQDGEWWVDFSYTFSGNLPITE
jgi:hypothetical protein